MVGCRFDRSYNVSGSAYRDVQLLVQLPGHEVIAELQLHLRSYFNVKSRLLDGLGRTGHDRYAQARQFLERLEFGEAIVTASSSSGSGAR